MSTAQAGQAVGALIEERKEFEAWYASDFKQRMDRRVPFDGYLDEGAVNNWVGWKARAALASDSSAQIAEWQHKAEDYDRLKVIARNRRMVLEEIAGSKSLTATPQQFVNILQGMAKKACEDYTFAGYDDEPAAQSAARTQGNWMVSHWYSDAGKSCGISNGIVGVAAVYGIGRAESQANARLVAAAPELLEACQEALRDLISDGHSHYRVADQLRDVIAKATGEQA